MGKPFVFVYITISAKLVSKLGEIAEQKGLFWQGIKYNINCGGILVANQVIVKRKVGRR